MVFSITYIIRLQLTSCFTALDLGTQETCRSFNTNNAAELKQIEQEGSPLQRR